MKSLGEHFEAYDNCDGTVHVTYLMGPGTCIKIRKSELPKLLAFLDLVHEAAVRGAQRDMRHALGIFQDPEQGENEP
jgi:hypothetical protein